MSHHRFTTAQEDQGNQQVVPNPQELEDRQRGNRRGDQREDHLGEYLPVIGTIKVGRLEQVLGGTACFAQAPRTSVDTSKTASMVQELRFCFI